MSSAGCYSQHKKVDVSTATPVVVTSSASTSDVLEKPRSFFATVDGDDISDALDLL